jgi:peptide/nickel transport system permease protein
MRVVDSLRAFPFPILALGRAAILGGSLGYAMVAEANLSFLGLGAQPGRPSWGSMLFQAQSYLTIAWWMAFFPGMAIFFAVLGFNLLGDGVREALDPRTYD